MQNQLDFGLPNPYAAAWISKAQEDIIAASQILKLRSNCPYSVVCFHAQQGVEKCLKALLTAMTIEFPKTHDIGELINLLPEGITVPLTIEDQERLTDYAVTIRYPVDTEPVSRDEAKSALALVRKTARFTLKALGLTPN